MGLVSQGPDRARDALQALLSSRSREAWPLLPGLGASPLPTRPSHRSLLTSHLVRKPFPQKHLRPLTALSPWPKPGSLLLSPTCSSPSHPPHSCCEAGLPKHQVQHAAPHHLLPWSPGAPRRLLPAARRPSQGPASGPALLPLSSLSCLPPRQVPARCLGHPLRSEFLTLSCFQYFSHVVSSS